VTEQPKSLRESVLSGVRWVAAARVAAEIAGFVSSIVLARLIAPAEFGHAVIALVVSLIAGTLAGEGFGTPLVQRKRVTRDHLQAAFALSLALGAFLTVAVLVLAPFVFEPVFGQRSAELVRLIAPAVLLSSLAVVPEALLQRDLDFRTLSAIEVFSLVASVVVSLTLAITGLNAEAVVLGALTLAVAKAGASLVIARPPLPRIRPAAARELTAFGLPSAFAGLTHAAQHNVDYAIIGARLDPAQVGFYWRAYMLGAEYQGKISAVMLRMALPVFSRSRDVRHMVALRLRIARVHAAVVLPLLALLVPLAPELVPALFGHAWEPAVVPTQILAFAGMCRALATGSGPLVLAAGRPDLLLAWNTGRLLILATLVWLVAPAGLIAVCVAVVGFRLVSLILSWQLMVKRAVGLPLRELWSEAAPGITCSLLLLAGATLLSALMTSIHAGAAATVVAVSALGATGYLLVLRALFPATATDLLMLARRTLGRSGPAPQPVGVAR
jgi:O-antigen/teichoic acid export membrane protein